MEQEDREDLTALHWAARLGQERVVLVLLDHKADVEVRVGFSSRQSAVAEATGGRGGEEARVLNLP